MFITFRTKPITLKLVSCVSVPETTVLVIRDYVLCSSLDIELHNFHRRVLIAGVLIATDSHLNIISGHCAEVLAEPRWGVERAARAAAATSLAIPERI